MRHFVKGLATQLLAPLSAAAALIAATAATPTTAAAATWIRDQNVNRIDDEIERAATLGMDFAYENQNPDGRVLFYVNTSGPEARYGLYIAYDHAPSAQDADQLEAIGVPYTHTYSIVDYIQTEATWEQIQEIAALPGVVRVEDVPAMYPTNDNGTRTLKARDSNYGLFPSVWRERGLTGKGIVIAVLDSGVNDQPLNGGTYPGHQSLIGKFLGGGNFFSGQPALNTALNASENPSNNPDAFLGTYHATHVAGTAMGTGGPSGLRGSNPPGYFAGVAPDARLVDCKAISDGGVGFGSVAAVEWCVHNKDNTWGLTGADTIYTGIDVLNLSIGSINSESNGLDASSLAIDAAVRAGLVACVATGNDHNTQFISSPASADNCISVGALEDGNSLTRDDDIVAAYSNEGPRDSDGDADHFDEMKPTICAPGSGIISANGDITTDGTLYKQINGTSMATPMTSGLCALILQANPNLNPFEVRQILEDTSDHKVNGGKQAPGAVDPFGLDANYHPSWGWGEPDAYAAILEALAPTRTQVIDMKAVPVLVGGPAVDVKWTTQREVNLGGFNVLRAPDANGRPGTFTTISPVNIPGTGDPYIHQTSNRTHYNYHDAGPGLEFGKRYWYQIVWVDVFGVSHSEPVFPVRIEAVPVVARVSFDFTHNSPDNDLTVWFGSGTDPDHPVYLRYPPGTPGEDSTSVDPIGDPLGVIGNVKHHFHVDLTALDMVDTFLPPSAANPWFLAVKEAGFVDQSGRVGSFKITVYTPTGETTYAAPNPPTETTENGRVVFWIPLDPITTVNHTPVLSPVGDRMVDEGQTLQIVVNATDPDGDALTYSASNLPAGASFSPALRKLTWSPTYSESGTYSVTFRATDTASNFDEETISIDVADIVPGSNRTPILTPTGDRYVRVGETLSLRIDATDPDGDVLTYASGPLPSGVSFNTSTGDLSWAPAANQVGQYPVNFSASDPSGRSANDAFLITVLDGVFSSGCNSTTTTINGTTQLAANGVPVANQDFPFTVAPNTQTLIGTLSWTNAPATDLDFYLLNAADEEVDSSPTVNHPEIISVANLPPGNYKWRVQSYTTPAGQPFTIQSVACVTQSTSGADDPGKTPRPRLSVAQNYPNPFNPATRIAYEVGERGRVTVRVFAADGRLVRVLADGVMEAGPHSLMWEGDGPDGKPVASGVYFYVVETKNLSERRKMVLLK